MTQCLIYTNINIFNIVLPFKDILVPNMSNTFIWAFFVLLLGSLSTPFNHKFLSLPFLLILSLFFYLCILIFDPHSFFLYDHLIHTFYMTKPSKKYFFPNILLTLYICMYIFIYLFMKMYMVTQPTLSVRATYKDTIHIHSIAIHYWTYLMYLGCERWISNSQWQKGW